jgi:hypothetical protein
VPSPIVEASTHPLSELKYGGVGCPFSYVSNYSLNGPNNYPIGFEVTGQGECTVTDRDFRVRIVTVNYEP